MWLSYVLLIIGFVLLVKGADFLVEGASSLAKKLKISDLVIGMTVVAFGTSMPEFVVNVIASLSGSSDIAIGNIVGSNISNVLLILGVSSCIFPIIVKKSTFRIEIPYTLLATFVLALLINDRLIDGAELARLTRIDGIIMIIFFVAFMGYNFVIAGNEFEEEAEELQLRSIPVSLLFVAGGILGLYFGGRWVIESAINIAEFFGLSQKLIGLTIVAFGTSLPELAASAMAAIKKNSDIAVGNIVGSNIFNIFWVLGFSSLINPIGLAVGVNTDIIISGLACILLFSLPFLHKDKKLVRSHGVIFILSYIAYVSFVFWRG